MKAKRILALVLSMLMIAALLPAMVLAADYADTVVYGTIRTADAENPTAEAIAVKGGRFVYVGDEAGAEAFIDKEKTQVIDHRNKGIIIPGCYEGHAHYIMAKGMELMGGPAPTLTTTVEQFMQMVKDAYNQAKTAGKSSIYGFGWMYQQFEVEGMPTRRELDALCPDVALYVSDAEGHKGLANTLCLQNAGIMDRDGNVLISEIRGGEICMDEDGKPTGLLKEQAGTYVRTHGINFNEIFPDALAKTAVEQAQEQLLANGYISYMDGWSNVFGTNAYYEGAKALDEKGELNMLLGMAYEFESSSEIGIEAEIEKAKQMKKYTGGHINADYVKIFIDGTVESGTGFTMEPYQVEEFGNGIANWEQDEVTKITELANNNGMTMHIHTMGDAAVNRAVNAFVAKGKKELRNTVVHARHVPEADFERMADNNIVAVSGILWHGMASDIRDILNMVIPQNLADTAYPMKSYFDKGAVMTSHCDYPATSGSPVDPFGIIEIAVTGQMHLDGKLTDPFWTDELISREQALQALTINGAYQMHAEDERGSIKVGKYADFVLADQDVFTCEATDIGKTKVVSTWFEGEKVYQAPYHEDVNQIIVTIGQKEATVFGETKTNDVAPLFRHDRTMLPIRFVAEALGAKVGWEETGVDLGIVTITKGDTTIVITINSDTAYVNGEEVKLDSPAFIENARTYLPIRFVAENLGAKVDWVEETQTVIITR